MKRLFSQAYSKDSPIYLPFTRHKENIGSILNHTLAELGLSWNGNNTCRGLTEDFDDTLLTRCSIYRVAAN